MATTVTDKMLRNLNYLGAGETKVAEIKQFRDAYINVDIQKSDILSYAKEMIQILIRRENEIWMKLYKKYKWTTVAINEVENFSFKNVINDADIVYSFLVSFGTPGVDFSSEKMWIKLDSSVMDAFKSDETLDAHFTKIEILECGKIKESQMAMAEALAAEERDNFLAARTHYLSLKEKYEDENGNLR